MTDPDEIKAEIEATRAELAESADALAAKLNVKAQATDRLHEVGDKVAMNVERVREAAPPPVQKAIDKASEDKQRTALAAGGAFVLLLLVRRLRKRRSTKASAVSPS